MTGLACTSAAPAATTRRRRSMEDHFEMVARVVLAVMILTTAGCAGTGMKASYHPTFLPVKLEWGSDGMVQVSGETSLVTPVGVFSIGAAYNLPEADDDAFYVVVRDARKSPDNPDVAGFDHIYKVNSGSGEFTAVVNGTAVIQVVRRQVIVDVTNGTVRTIEFRNAETAVKERSAGIGDRWQEFWDASFYSPMALSRWAYDDSTMSSWFGLGFLWFLVRLALAIVLGVVDVILVVGCTLAAVAYVLIGPTGRNIVYGVEALLLLFLALSSWAGLKP
ncbi:hypothetical protein ACIA8R_36870 [Nonomuraea sp. NPDC051191]|uniref:hypothetical protein n=1 Tax=Nonomuraea sp. NPDC051191 TaxID=3364372 RepID=UPI0037AD7A21